MTMIATGFDSRYQQEPLWGSDTISYKCDDILPQYQQSNNSQNTWQSSLGSDTFSTTSDTSNSSMEFDSSYNFDDLLNDFSSNVYPSTFDTYVQTGPETLTNLQPCITVNEPYKPHSNQAVWSTPSQQEPQQNCILSPVEDDFEKVEISEDEDQEFDNNQPIYPSYPSFGPPFSHMEHDVPECSYTDPTSNQKTNSINEDSRRQYNKPCKQPILYNFLYHALEHPKDYGNMIKWVDRSKGVFEFSSKNKENLARAWGKVKNNRQKMTYQKMSRALRIYIKKGVVMKKMKRKLQYNFLPDFLTELHHHQGLKLSADIVERMYETSRNPST